MAIVVALAGAGIGGAAFGSAAAGWVVGSILGNLLFPASVPDQEGPRLDDLSVVSSAYGVPIPKNFGTVKTSGNIIWALPVREQKKTEQVGGKGGGGGGNVTSYSYYATFAMGISQGEASKILRIWANEKLIYDHGEPRSRTVGDFTVGDVLEELQEAVTGVRPKEEVPQLEFTFYKGSEDQEPDPLIVIDKGDEAPSYKGLCYLVFDDLPLADYGNSIPSISVEVSYNSPPEFSTESIGYKEGLGEFGAEELSCLTDWERRKIYSFDTNHGRITVLDLDSMESSPSVSIEDTNGPDFDYINDYVGVVVSRFDGNLYFQAGYTITNGITPLHRFHPVTFKALATFGTFGGLPHVATPSKMPASAGLVEILVGYPNSAETESFLVSCQVPLASAPTSNIYVINTATMEYVAGEGMYIGYYQTMGRGREGVESSEVWLADRDNELYKLTIEKGASSIVTSFGVNTTGITLEQFKTFSQDLKEIYLDAEDGNPIIRYTDGVVDGWLKLNRADPNDIIWQTEVPVQVGSNNIAYARYVSSGNSFYEGGVAPFIHSQDSVIFLNLEDGSIVDKDSVIPAFRNFHENFVYNHKYNQGINPRTRLTEVWRVDFNIAGQYESQTTVGDVVSYLCNKTGISDSEIDVSELTDKIPGFMMARTSAARTWIDMLARNYFFEGLESDFTLKFPKRNKTTSLSILPEELIKNSKDSSSFSVVSMQEPELPKVLELNYINQETDYEPDTVRSTRISQPIQTMFSNNKVAHTATIISNPFKMKKISEVLLYLSWLERESYSFKLPYKYLKLDPTDVISVTSNIGTFISRIAKTQIGGGMVLDISAISHDESTYISVANGVGGTPTQQTIPGINTSTLYVLSTPLLDPSDDTGGSGLRNYFAMSSVGQPGWGGATLLKSNASDNFNVDPIEQASVEIPSGLTTTALGDFPHANVIDYLNFITFNPTYGDESVFSSTTVEEMLNGDANVVLVGKEIIKFATATHNADGTISLSVLLRGRKNTEQHMPDHIIGDQVLFLSPKFIKRISGGLSEFKQDRFYKAVGFGQTPETAKTLTVNSSGEAELPYSVYALKSEDVGADTSITWQRRTRGDGSWKTGTNTVPLFESFEKYEVDVIDNNLDKMLTTYFVENSTEVTVPEASKTSWSSGPPDTTPVPVSGSNLECNSLSGWTLSQGSVYLRNSIPDPQEGSYYFSGENNQGFVVYQNIDLSPHSADIASGRGRLKVEWFQSGLTVNNDPGYVMLEFFDQSGELLFSKKSPTQAVENQTWVNKILTSGVPDQSTSVKLSLVGLHREGDTTNANFDNIRIEIQQKSTDSLKVKVYQMSESVGRGRQLEEIIFPI